MPTRDTRAAYFGGGGEIVVTTVTVPAAGAEIVQVVPVARRWRFITMRFRLVTDANVANREPQIFFDEGGNIFLHSGTNAGQTASQGRDYTVSDSPILAGILTNARQIATPSDVLLGTGFRIITNTPGLQVGDQYSAIFLLTEEWIDR